MYKYDAYNAYIVFVLIKAFLEIKDELLRNKTQSKQKTLKEQVENPFLMLVRD